MKKIVICGSKGKCGKEVYRLLKQEGYQILDCVNEHGTIPSRSDC